MKHIVLYSGGIGSWYAAKMVAEKYGTKKLILLFTDTKMEDEDLYRFLYESAKDVGGKLTILCDGRNPWEVFKDEKFLGNSRVDPCSKILKRQLARKWIDNLFDPNEVTVYLGIDWTESHRFMRAVKYWEPFIVKAPMCEEPYIEKEVCFKALEAAGIKKPRLYDLGFAHNNCGGFCIKAGQGQFKNLLEKMPERFDYHAKRERDEGVPRKGCYHIK